MPVGEEERRHPVLAGSPRAVGRECHRWSGKGRRARARPRPRRLPPALVLAPPYFSPATLHGHPDPVAHACSRGPGTAATAKRTRGRLCGRTTECEAESTTCTAGRNGFVHSATPVYSCSLINASAQQSRPPSSRVWPVCEPQQQGRPGQKRSVLWVHPTPCRTLSIAPGLHPRDANSTSRSCDNPNCLRTPLTGSCRGRGLPRTAVSRESGPASVPASVPVNHAGLGQDGTGDAAFSRLRQALKPSVPGTGL